MYSTIEHTRSSFYKVYLASRKKRHQELMSKQFPKDTVPDFVWSSRIYIDALPAAVLVPALEIERRLSAPRAAMQSVLHHGPVSRATVIDFFLICNIRREHGICS